MPTPEEIDAAVEIVAAELVGSDFQAFITIAESAGLIDANEWDAER